MSDNFRITTDGGKGKTLVITAELSEDDTEELSSISFSAVLLRGGGPLTLDSIEHSHGRIESLVVSIPEFEWSVVPCLPRLRKLVIGGYWPVPWDQLRGSRLRSLSAYWDNKYDIDDIQLPNLTELKLVGWTEQDLVVLQKFDLLNYLDLVDSPKLETLDGCQFMSSLKTIRVRGAPKLSTLRPIPDCEQLLVLHCERLRRLQSYVDIQSLENLRALILQECPAIDSLHFLADFKRLELLELGTTAVVDGDTAFLKNLQSLKKVLYKNKRGYNWSYSDAVAHFNSLPASRKKFSSELEDAIKMKL